MERTEILKYKNKDLISLNWKDKDLGNRQEYRGMLYVMKLLYMDIMGPYGWEIRQKTNGFIYEKLWSVMDNSCDEDFFVGKEDDKYYMNLSGIDKVFRSLSETPDLSSVEKLNIKIYFFLYLLYFRLVMVSKYDGDKYRYNRLLDDIYGGCVAAAGDLGIGTIEMDKILTTRKDYELLLWWLKLNSMVLWIKRLAYKVYLPLLSFFDHYSYECRSSYMSSHPDFAYEENKKLKHAIGGILKEMRGESIGVGQKLKTFWFVFGNVFGKRSIEVNQFWFLFANINGLILADGVSDLKAAMHKYILRKAGISIEEWRKHDKNLEEVHNKLVFIDRAWPWRNKEFIKFVWKKKFKNLK